MIIDRKLPQTALSIVANDASYVGKKLNECLLSPAQTTRAQETSHYSQNTNGAAKLVTEDPNDVILYKYFVGIFLTRYDIMIFCLYFQFRINQNKKKSNNSTTSSTTTTTTNSKTEVNRVATNLLDEKKRTNIRINNIDDIYSKDEAVQSGYIETKSNSIKLDHEISIPKPTMMNRRRKTITAFDFEPNPTTKLNDKSKAKFSSIIDDPHLFRNYFNDNTANDSNSKKGAVKLNARDVASSSVAKVKTALTIVKPASPISKRPKIAPTRTIVHNHIANTEPIKPCPTNILKQKLPIKISDPEYTKKDDLLNQIRNQKVHTVASDPSTTEANVNFKKRIESPIYRKDFIPIPSARNPNIVKTNDRTIMHVTPIQQNEQLNLLNRKPIQIQKKHIVQVISPQTHARTITIHPDNVMFEGKSNSEFSFRSQAMVRSFDYFLFFAVGKDGKEKFNDRVGNWQNYDPSNIEISNEYANETIAGTRNNHSYPDVVMEDIVYADNIEEDIIAEEYIASEEFSPG